MCVAEEDGERQGTESWLRAAVMCSVVVAVSPPRDPASSGADLLTMGCESECVEIQGVDGQEAQNYIGEHPLPQSSTVEPSFLIQHALKFWFEAVCVS